MTDAPPYTSTLISIRPGGSEDRKCGQCGEAYLLPIPYERCNPKSRDLCTPCIRQMGIERAEAEEIASIELARRRDEN